MNPLKLIVPRGSIRRHMAETRRLRTARGVESYDEMPTEQQLTPTVSVSVFDVAAGRRELADVYARASRGNRRQ